MENITSGSGWPSSGSGTVFGPGPGYGFGSGFGFGVGFGIGSSSGSGTGYIFWFGDCDGSGYGDVFSASDGYGSGSGSITEYCQAIASSYTHPDSVICLWKSDESGRSINGGDCGPVEIGMTQSIEGKPVLCKRGFHGTFDLRHWGGSRLWIVALHDPVYTDGDKFVSAKRTILDEIDCFC